MGGGAQKALIAPLRLDKNVSTALSRSITQPSHFALLCDHKTGRGWGVLVHGVRKVQGAHNEAHKKL